MGRDRRVFLSKVPSGWMSEFGHVSDVPGVPVYDRNAAEADIHDLQSNYDSPASMVLDTRVLFQQ